MKRREFVSQTLVGALAVALALKFSAVVREEPALDAGPELRTRGLVRPPGALDEAAFLAACIRCTLCADVCEPRAIRLFGPGAGHLQGTPYIRPETAACNLCLRCGPACPTGALLPLAQKTLARMGTAVVDEALCVSTNGTGICGACYTVCPLRGKAITQGSRFRPTVHPAVCVGCGLCEEACIVKRDKAIRVFSPRRIGA
ncbi:MAG: 4Fe-4S dicluster domain-containing protein [Planctomycetes bacterium]|nr:4Fe-4S dicluster domain-containing protein [Planctomycetota bacterium]